MKKKRKISPLVSMIQGGVGIGVGSQVVGSIPGPYSATISSGIGNMATFYPVMGTTYGAGLALKQLNKLKQRKRKRK